MSCGRFNVHSGAGLFRSSQPKTGIGMFGTVNSLDQAYVVAIANTGQKKPMLIVDCRPAVNAYASAVAGGGYETNYPDASLQFFEIANIHIVRAAHQHLKNAAASASPPSAIMVRLVL